MMLLGIDPGVTGAVAVFVDGVFDSVHDMPFMTEPKKTKKRVDPDELADLLTGAMAFHNEFHDDVCAYIEQAHAMPQQGVSSVFGYGRTMGVIEGVLAGIGVINVYKVCPARWKRALGLVGKGNPKDADLQLARKLYPNAYLNLQKHHNRADAILIGHYAGMLNGVICAS